MGLWQVDADTLAGSRFLVSPLAETTATLMALERGTVAQQAVYRRQLSPVTASLVRTALGRRWVADFLTPTPTGVSGLAFGDELEAISGADPARARADLEESSRGALPVELERDDLPSLMAEVLTCVWTEVVRPRWDRSRRILEADVLSRTARLGSSGWAAALDTMRPGMRWLGDGRLRINALDYPPREVLGARLFFVPVTMKHGWVSYDESDRHAVVYPCAGVLASPDRVVPAGLGKLVGPARAAVLTLLGTPMSTTQLVALTGQQLGSVGGHLRVLLEAGLIGRRRTGRSVLYYRTAAGEVLLRAGESSMDAYPATRA